MRPRDLRRWLPRLGAGYVVLGLLAALTPGFEIFPFFSWFLFPVVPGDEPRYELVVERFEGHAVHPPRDVQTLGVFEDPKAMDLWILTRRLGRALDAGDPEAIARARRLLEGSFLCAGSRYTVERVRFDPLVRWHTGQVDARARLADFESEAECRRSPWAKGLR